jgi:hypothetical protein
METETIICDWCGKHFEREKKKDKEPDYYYCSDECRENNSDAGFKEHT